MSLNPTVSMSFYPEDTLTLTATLLDEVVVAFLQEAYQTEELEDWQRIAFAHRVASDRELISSLGKIGWEALFTELCRDTYTHSVSDRTKPHPARAKYSVCESEEELEVYMREEDDLLLLFIEKLNDFYEAGCKDDREVLKYVPNFLLPPSAKYSICVGKEELYTKIQATLPQRVLLLPFVPGFDNIIRFRVKQVALGMRDYPPPFSLGDNVFYQWTALQSVDFKGVYGVFEIGNSFLAECSSLRHVDLTPFRTVTRVGDSFMQFCAEITHLQLEPLRNVTSVGHNFLYECFGLRSLDLSPMRNLASIGDKFLAGCSQICELDLYSLWSTESVGNFFLWRCAGLYQVNLTPLWKQTRIGNGFLCDCSGLSSIDLFPLRNVSTIGSHFLAGCTRLRVIDCAALNSVTSVGPRFLDSCSALSVAAVSWETAMKWYRSHGGVLETDAADAQQSKFK